jgi:hypothetical protein
LNVQVNSAAKRDRRLEAQRRAAELRRVEARRARIRTIGIATGVVVAVAAVATLVTVVVVNGQGGQTASASASSAATSGPWAAPTDVEKGVRAAGLTMLSAEGSALHIHQHLSLSVDGKTVTVPAQLGIDAAAGQISPIHTHDESGIIHVESPTVRGFTLGQVFDEWQVPLGSGRVGAYTDGSGGRTVTVFVDGKKYAGDPAGIALREHEDIDIVVAKQGATVAAPAAFAWPSGY